MFLGEKMARILIIEDSFLSRRTIAKILSNDHEIIEATNGAEGLEFAAQKSPDCIVLDLLMPDMDGREVLQHLRQQGSTIPVIVVTADIQRSSRQDCLALGAITVIAKLPDPDQLKNAIAVALESRWNIPPCISQLRS